MRIKNKPMVDSFQAKLSLLPGVKSVALDNHRFDINYRGHKMVLNNPVAALTLDNGDVIRVEVAQMEPLPGAVQLFMDSYSQGNSDKSMGRMDSVNLPEDADALLNLVKAYINGYKVKQ